MKQSKVTPGSNLMWESSRMFLPEHKHALNEYRLRQKEFHPPELDPDALVEINRTLRTAVEEGREISITYARKYGPDVITGRIKKIDPHSRQIMMRTNGEVVTLSFEKILGAEL